MIFKKICINFKSNNTFVTKSEVKGRNINGRNSARWEGDLV